MVKAAFSSSRGTLAVAVWVVFHEDSKQREAHLRTLQDRPAAAQVVRDLQHKSQTQAAPGLSLGGGDRALPDCTAIAW
jgi:hypothetical protein